MLKSTKLREFQFKIIHRAYASKAILSKFVTDINEFCDICNVKNNLMHTFVSCTRVIVWWENFIKWYNTLMNVNVTLNSKIIIFGILEPDQGSICLNFCLFHAKWYIHKSILDKKDYTLFDFLIYLKNILQLEFNICQRMKQSVYFEKNFGHMFENL